MATVREAVATVVAVRAAWAAAVPSVAVAEAEAAAEVVFQEARDGARREYGGCPSHREAGGSR